MPVVSVAQVTSSAEGGGMSLVATGDWSVSGLGKVDSQLSAINMTMQSLFPSIRPG